MVLVTKYRHPVLTGDVKTAVYERINYVAESRGFNILELNGELDHI
ncbi:transposase, partial [Blautia stercoris]